jgi:hypothetical protein
VTETVIRILIGSIVIIFLAVSYLWKKPITDFGKISLKVCVANAAGWLIILPLSDRGHPPQFLFPAVLFWLLNFLLLPAAATVLWLSHRDGQEKRAYLVATSIYITMNVVMLYVVPLIGILYEGDR